MDETDLLSIADKMSQDSGERFRTLIRALKEMERPLVAFSGGVDSSLLAFIASSLVPDTQLGLIDSPFIPRKELEFAMSFARDHKLQLEVVKHDIFADPAILRNGSKRCYHCKLELFGALKELMTSRGCSHLLDGSNIDDLSDYRPGAKATGELGVISPFQDAGLTKEHIREISRMLGLSTWDKPAMACLASRIPWGSEITMQKLTMIEKAEDLLKSQGYREVRVRHQGELARIELGPDETPNLAELRDIVPPIKALGFLHVALDLEGYKMGGANDLGKA